MKYLWATVVVACLAVSFALASECPSDYVLTTARALGMGNATIAVADDAAAWRQNPAGLASLNVPVAEGKLWGNDLMGTYSRFEYKEAASTSTAQTSVPLVKQTDTGWAADWSGWQPAKGMGAGAGYADTETAKYYGAGFGMGVKDLPLNFGVSILREDPDEGDGNTLFNAGALYKFAQPGNAAPLKLGLVVKDITGETDTGATCNLGVAWPATPALTVAVDVADVTGKSDDGPFYSGGAEYALKVGTGAAAGQFLARAGVLDNGDTNLTAGVGYKTEKFRIDAAYADLEDGLWQISAATSF